MQEFVVISKCDFFFYPDRFASVRKTHEAAIYKRRIG